MKKFMERFIEAVRKYEELLSYAQGGFIRERFKFCVNRKN